MSSTPEISRKSSTELSMIADRSRSTAACRAASASRWWASATATWSARRDRGEVLENVAHVQSPRQRGQQIVEGIQLFGVVSGGFGNGDHNGSTNFLFRRARAGLVPNVADRANLRKLRAHE